MKFALLRFYLEKIIFYILIFSIPFQTRKIFYFWDELFNEWTSVSLYWTDILIFALFIFWFIRFINNFRSIKLSYTHYFLLSFIVWSGISIFFSSNIYLGIYGWVKLLEMVFVFIYVRDFVRRRSRNGLVSILWVFILSAFFQASIASLQFFYQGSAGFNILHESPLGTLIDGVAKLNFADLQIVRAYGTFPHPNVLAAFLGLAIFSCYWLWLRDEGISRIKSYILWYILSTLFMGLFFTFSRSVILLIVILSIFFFVFLYFHTSNLYKRIKIRELFLIVVLYIAVLVLLFQPLLIERFDVDLGEQAVDLRAFYNNVALDFIKQSPMFGVGIGNFVHEFKAQFSNLESWQHQPAHNLYLLIASETGIVGLVFFLIFIGLLLKSVFVNLRNTLRKEIIFAVFVLCFMFYALGLGLFDHYFWTLQQGRLMMWLVFGIAAAVSLDL